VIAQQEEQRPIVPHGDALGAGRVILVYLCTCIRVYYLIVIAHEIGGRCAQIVLLTTFSPLHTREIPTCTMSDSWIWYMSQYFNK
jgi:hypothetical protein